MNTTAGSFALLNSVPPGDSIIVASLRKAGAVILGKTNMSVWAQARGNTTQGWSPRGGYTYSAFYPRGNACSSSSGAGVATSIGLAAASIGSETDGSIICPGTRNSLVGFKPTVGFASRFGIIPISSTQDTAGPMTKSVEDAAIMLTSMFTPKNPFQGKLDSAVQKQPRKVARGIDYAQRLIDLHLEDKEYPLVNVRIGITRGALIDPDQNDFDEEVVEVYEKALKQLEQAGATLVNVTFECNAQEVSDDRHTVLSAEFYGEFIRSFVFYSVNDSDLVLFNRVNAALYVLSQAYTFGDLQYRRHL
jgi:amidase